MEVESYHLSMTTPPPAPRDDVPTYAGERVKAFADAVVAIAMTLLILPLMESIADVAASADPNRHVIHRGRLVSSTVATVTTAAWSPATERQVTA